MNNYKNPNPLFANAFHQIETDSHNAFIQSIDRTLPEASQTFEAYLQHEGFATYNDRMNVLHIWNDTVILNGNTQSFTEFEESIYGAKPQ